jgi:hypothetical protein
LGGNLAVQFSLSELLRELERTGHGLSCGVGKSSSVFHLGGYFASQGLHVLLIDNEPQHSLTNGLIGLDAATALAPEQTTAQLFAAPQVPPPEQLIRTSTIHPISSFVPTPRWPPPTLPTSVKGSVNIAEFSLFSPRQIGFCGLVRPFGLAC